MQGVILVGGEGTRLRPLTWTVPKPMVPILNRPFLEWMIGHLRGHGIDDIILGLCYLPDRIRDYFGEGERHGVRLTYVREETPLGTAGAVQNVADHLDRARPFFVFNGDVFSDIDLSAMLRFHRERGAVATISLTPVPDPSAFGVVDHERDGRVRRFIEKPPPGTAPTNLINAGTYVLEPTVLDFIPRGQHYMFERGVFPGLLDAGKPVYSWADNSYWVDIGTPERYHAVHRDLLTGQVHVAGLPQYNARGVAPGEGCQIDPSARLTGPILLGPGCAIAANAELTGPLALGPSCRIGEGAIVVDSVLGARVEIASGGEVRGAILGPRCRVARGAVVAGGAVLGEGVTVESGNRLDRGLRVNPDQTVVADMLTF